MNKSKDELICFLWQQIIITTEQLQKLQCNLRNHTQVDKTNSGSFSFNLHNTDRQRKTQQVALMKIYIDVSEGQSQKEMWDMLILGPFMTVLLLKSATHQLCCKNTLK